MEVNDQTPRRLTFVVSQYEKSTTIYYTVNITYLVIIYYVFILKCQTIETYGESFNFDTSLFLSASSLFYATV